MPFGRGCEVYGPLGVTAPSPENASHGDNENIKH